MAKTPTKSPSSRAKNDFVILSEVEGPLPLSVPSALVLSNVEVAEGSTRILFSRKLKNELVEGTIKTITGLAGLN